jgi:thiol-disulfide isomerase/thioredoxin
VRLSDYRGRVVFVNFWGTWCPPCVEELPEFERFASDQGDQGAVVLAVNSSETADQITSFLTENEITLDHVPVLLDSDYDVLRAFGVADLLPTTFVIAPDGTIAWIKFGAMTQDLMQVYVDDVLAAQEG